MNVTDSPIISVVLPSLNVVDYIAECLGSVVAQTLQDIEIICVDGGSTDGTLEIIKEYASKDHRITIIHSERKSYGFQMNLGIAASKGKYIGIVETDDYIAPDMYEKLYSYAKKFGVDFIKGGYTAFFDFAEEHFYTPYLNKKCREVYDCCIDLRVNRQIGMYDPVHIWSGIYRKDFLIEKEIWFHESPGASYQDISFSVLVGLMADTCVYTDDCSYHYRIDNVNSSVKSGEKVECEINEFAYIYNYLKQHGGVSPEINLLVDRYKLIIYRGTYSRLSGSNRNKFLNAISGEMRDFMPGGIYADVLNDEEQEYVGILTDPQYANSILLREEETIKETIKIYQELLAKIAMGKKFVIMGAGEIFEKLILIQKLIKRNYILGVCDNSDALQGTNKAGYCIMSVDGAVLENQDAEWLIANKYHCDEMESQLQNAGIESNKIYLVNRMISNEHLVDLICLLRVGT